MQFCLRQYVAQHVLQQNLLCLPYVKNLSPHSLQFLNNRLSFIVNKNCVAERESWFQEGELNEFLQHSTTQTPLFLGNNGV